MGCGCGKNNPPEGLNSSRGRALQEAKEQRNESNNGEREDIVKHDTPQSRPNNPKTPAPPSLVKRASSLAKSAVSRGISNKRADPVAKRLRVLSCHGDPDQLNSQCPYREESNKKRNTFYCTACGCGDNSNAWLNNPSNSEAYVKLDFPWLSCPLKMPGFSDYVPTEEQNEELIEKYSEESLERKTIIENLCKAWNLEIPAAEAPPQSEKEKEERPEPESD